MSREISDRLREPSLSTAFWGYDRAQVDALLRDISRRIKSSESTPALELPAIEGVGEKVEAILASARAAAEHLQVKVQEGAAEVTREAEEHARRVRGEADEKLETASEDARAEAEKIIAEAEEEADEMLRHARLELGRVKESVSELEERRHGVITSIERLRGVLAQVAATADSADPESYGPLGAGELTTAPDAVDDAEAGLEADEWDDDYEDEELRETEEQPEPEPVRHDGA